MSKYIELAKFSERIKKHIKPDNLEEKALIEWCIDECIRQGHCMPTADVVEVVRCKDCLYSYFNTSSLRYTCQREYPRRSVEEDDFCNHGRRSNDGT